jgi:hypothetical protein
VMDHVRVAEVAEELAIKYSLPIQDNHGCACYYGTNGADHE